MLLVVRVVFVVRLRLAVGHGQQRRLGVHARLLFPALRCDLFERLGYGWILK